jgi:hypothetical protein
VRAEAVSGVTVIPAGGLVLFFDTRRLDCVLMGGRKVLFGCTISGSSYSSARKGLLPYWYSVIPVLV